MIELFSDPASWAALFVLSLLEVVLGIDNVIFLSILVGRLELQRQHAARIVGLALAMLTRIMLLFSIVWLTRLTRPWFLVAGFGVSGRDLILLAGGLFLLVKSPLEIHATLQGVQDDRQTRRYANFVAIVVQIAVVDIVFSLDSVFTAVGLARPNQVPIMVIAIVIAMLVMMGVSASIGNFIERNPTVKILALAFLIMVGMALVAESAHFGIPKPYLYVAMAFSVAVEMVNLRLRKLLDARRRSSGEQEGGG